MKIVAVSDIHGYYTELMTALDGAGFRPGDPGQLLVVCGDCFDRGAENMKVYRFLTALPNRVIIRGNHEDILKNVLTDRVLDETDYYNGTDKTVLEFLKKENGKMMSPAEVDSAIENEFMPFLDSLKDYYETENHIFVHGWLPFEYEGERLILTDHRTATAEQWFDARETGWDEALVNGLECTGRKTVVCGHMATQIASEFDRGRSSDDSSVYYGNNFIAIDANVMTSGRINALVIEDEQII